MRALVAGGAGFIGSHLCRALLGAGHSVACVDNFSLGTSCGVEGLLSWERFRLYETDVTDRAGMRCIFGEERPEYVFHLAANSDIKASALNPDVEYRNTYTTTFELLECMREYHVKRLFLHRPQQCMVTRGTWYWMSIRRISRRYLIMGRRSWGARL